MTAAIFFCALPANGLRSMVALSASACCRCGIAARAAAPSRPNAASDSTASSMSVSRSVCSALIERGLAPDMHVGLAAEAEEALLLPRFTSSEISSRSPEAATLARLTVTRPRREPSSGKSCRRTAPRRSC